MAEAKPCTQAYGPIHERATLFLAVYRELTRRFGEDEAYDVMGTVSRRLGLEDGAPLARHAPSGFAGLLEDFFKAPDGGATFLPDVIRSDASGLDVKMMRCPLKDAWFDAGCSASEVCKLLECASAYDRAVMEAAGFDLDLELWAPGKDGCCRSKVTQRQDG